ncbi:MAG: tubulin/FtsZ family protein [Natrialbaceae archaeon]
MKLALFGVGNAGVRIVDRLLAAEAEAERPFVDGQVLAVNTTPSTFAAADHIPDDRQVVVGDTHPDVVAPDPDAESEDDDSAGESTRREGVAGDPELAVEAAQDDLPELRRALDSIDDTEVDAAMVVAGFGGGTGCGVGAVLLDELTSIYEVPVYALGVLPTSAESDRRAWTAARAIRTFVPLADAVFPVDNEAWSTGGDAAENYAGINGAIATRIVSLFGAGERDDELLSELRMDPNDIMRTLDVGGLATVGYTMRDLDPETEGWLTKLRRLVGLSVPEPEAQADAMTIKHLVKRAVESKLTLPCNVSSADRVLLVLSGPPKELSRKGFETGRKLLEDETGTVEILAGDEPLSEASSITATVLLSNVTDVPRVEAIQRRAVAFQRELAESERHGTDDGPETERTDDGPETERTDGDGHGFDFQDEELLEQPTEESDDETPQQSADSSSE